MSTRKLFSMSLWMSPDYHTRKYSAEWSSIIAIWSYAASTKVLINLKSTRQYAPYGAFFMHFFPLLPFIYHIQIIITLSNLQVRWFLLFLYFFLNTSITPIITLIPKFWFHHLDDITLFLNFSMNFRLYFTYSFLFSRIQKPYCWPLFFTSVKTKHFNISPFS